MEGSQLLTRGMMAALLRDSYMGSDDRHPIHIQDQVVRLWHP